jgi:uncharacterized protein (TIGR03435 family)
MDHHTGGFALTERAPRQYSRFHGKNTVGDASRPIQELLSRKRENVTEPDAGRGGSSMRRMLCCGLLGLSLCRAYCQVTPPQPVFEVADIKLNKSGEIKNDYFTIQPGGVFIAHNAKISELFEFAFKIRRDVISGAPSWFDADRVDITAKATPATTNENLRLMVESLLINEFKIVMHSEQKNMSAFVLVVGKGGSKLQKTASDGRADCQRVGDQGQQFGGTHLACSNMTIAELAQGLPDLASGYIDRPVVDGTGLADAYDFRLDWVGRKSADLDGGPTIFTAIEKLGLRFEQRKVALPTIVIDRMEKLSGMQ